MNLNLNLLKLTFLLSTLASCLYWNNFQTQDGPSLETKQSIQSIVSYLSVGTFIGTSIPEFVLKLSISLESDTLYQYLGLYRELIQHYVRRRDYWDNVEIIVFEIYWQNAIFSVVARDNYIIQVDVRNDNFARI